MVKIVNTLGDVKVGKQGAAVYQRKYGEQIRRVLSPKSAIPSQRQLEHRQLYREALVWRSGLSRANRNYLDGYCIANWVVDSYKIPLAWSRFALKLYLEAVKFPMTKETIVTPEGDPEIKTFFDWFYNYAYSYYGNNWRGQTFITPHAFICDKVELMMRRAGSLPPWTFTMALRETDIDGKPTGEDIATKSIDFETVGIEYHWHEFIFDTPVLLQANTKYSLVFRLSRGTGSKKALGRASSIASYPNGDYVKSTDSGVSWSFETDWDLYFKVWGYTPEITEVFRALSVRHPALLTVVHRREGNIIYEEDTLSSLDEEYITSQVGLDVLVGDSIEVTTLPGIEYSYEVV